MTSADLTTTCSGRTRVEVNYVETPAFSKEIILFFTSIVIEVHLVPVLCLDVFSLSKHRLLGEDPRGCGDEPLSC